MNFCEISGFGAVAAGFDALKAKLNLADEFDCLLGPVGGGLPDGPRGIAVG